MTPNPAQPLPALLTPALLAVFLRAMLDALPVLPEATAEDIAALRQGATDAVTSLQPATPLQAILACRFIAATFAVMESMRRSLLKDLPPNVAVRYAANSIRLSRMMDVTLRELQSLQFEARLQARHAQKQAAGAAPEAARPAQPAAPVPPPRAQPQPAPAPIERRHPMPSGAPAQPPRSAIELPPAPPHPHDAWIAEEMARRRAATAAGAKTHAA